MTPVLPSSERPIVLIAPYRELADAAETLIRRHGFPARVAVGDLEEGLALGKILAREGAEIFISRGGTAQRLRETGLPVVEIKATAYDLLSALERVGPAGRSVAVIAFENVIAGISRLNPFFGHDVRVFPITREHEAREMVLAAGLQGADLVLGDMVVCTLARAAGLETVLIESGAEAIVDALLEASERLALLREEGRKNRRQAEVLSLLKSMFETADDVILIKDKTGRMISLDPATQKLLRDSLQALPPSRTPPPPRRPGGGAKPLTPLRRRDLAESMGISRTTLWRRLKSLEEHNL